MTPRRHRPCPICLHGEGDHVYHNVMAPIAGLDLSYHVSRCSECGFLYASELPTSAVYENYYRNLSKYDVISSAADVSPVERGRMASAVALCREHLDNDAIIVDIGCGSGGLLHAFQAAGWSNLHGIDPAPGAMTKAATLFGLPGVRTGTLRQAPELLPLGQADLVCMTGVLEHLPDLHEDLGFLAENVSPSAMILVEVPALERFVRDPMEAFGEFSLEHIQYFSLDSLSRLMAVFGFDCVAHDLVALSGGVTDSLFGLFARRGEASLNAYNVGDSPEDRYIQASEVVMGRVLERITQCRADRFVIYGAGSHTARLLPRLGRSGNFLEWVVGVVDGNPNLIGQRIGGHGVLAPTELSRWPDATVIVSSFGAQRAIADFVARAYPNPILLLYP